MYKSMNDKLSKLKKYSKTETGKSALKYLFIGFIAGMLWRLVLIILIFLILVYCISYYFECRKKDKKNKKEGVQDKKAIPHEKY